jgi:hypothetical protein
MSLCGQSSGPAGKYVGGCGDGVDEGEVFRCIDCCAPFHRECLREHCARYDCKDAEIQRLEQLVAGDYKLACTLRRRVHVLRRQLVKAARIINWMLR